MSVSAVKNYENKNPLSTVLLSTAIGGGIGYYSKTAIGLTKNEKKDINYKAIVNSSRKSVNRNKVNSFKILKQRTEAQDAFIKMVDNKTPFKHPTIKDLAERLGGEATETGKKVLAKINENAGLTFDELVQNLGKDSKEANELKRVAKLSNAFASENINVIVKKLGGEESNAGKEFRRIIKEVDKDASANARDVLKACHRVLKDKRYAAPLVIAGAAAGFAAAFVHNILSTKTEA